MLDQVQITKSSKLQPTKRIHAIILFLALSSSSMYSIPPYPHQGIGHRPRTIRTISSYPM